jgi:hypothetical protein
MGFRCNVGAGSPWRKSSAYSTFTLGAMSQFLLYSFRQVDRASWYGEKGIRGDLLGLRTKQDITTNTILSALALTTP